MRDNRRTRFVLGALLLASFTLITLDLRGDGGPVSGIRSAPARCSARSSAAVSSVVTPIGNFFGGLTEDEQARLEQLEKENAELRLQQRTDDYTPPAGPAARRPAAGGRARPLPHPAGPGHRRRPGAGLRVDGPDRRRDPRRSHRRPDGAQRRRPRRPHRSRSPSPRPRCCSSSTRSPRWGCGSRATSSSGSSAAQGLGALELEMPDPQAPLADGRPAGHPGRRLPVRPRRAGGRGRVGQEHAGLARSGSPRSTRTSD